MLAAKTKIGPDDHGRKMSLKEFEFAEVEEGYVYELARGYVVVSEVPRLWHALQVALIRKHLDVYDYRNPGVAFAILEGGSCKLLIGELQSERHPDIAVYVTAPIGPKGRTLWRRWIPDLAIEVVSESSRDRDYAQKPEEYFKLGVKEYWIVDANREKVTVLKRGRSDWTSKTLGPKDACETRLLPGFKLLCRDIFKAAAEAEEQ
jgi:Uma2 family endonuclease